MARSTSDFVVEDDPPTPNSFKISDGGEGFYYGSFSGFKDNLPKNQQNRIMFMLIAEGIYDLNDLLKFPEKDLLRIPRIGGKTIQHIKHSLAEIGYKLLG